MRYLFLDCQSFLALNRFVSTLGLILAGNLKRYAKMSIFKKLFGNKEPQEPISWVSGEDPKMQGAIKKSKDSYHDFYLAITQDMRRVVPAITDSLLKYAFPTPQKGARMEHMFLKDFELEGVDLYGYLASEPQLAKNFSEGDRIKIDIGFVSDWIYVTSEGSYGGYTFEVMWSGFSSEEKQLYIEHPPFCWLRSRLLKQVK